MKNHLVILLCCIATSGWALPPNLTDLRAAAGQIGQEAWYGLDGKRRNNSLYSYDSKGRIEREDWYDPDGNRAAYGVYSYNDKGRLERQDWFNPKDEKLAYYIYTYNYKGQTGRRDGHSPDGKKTGYLLYTYNHRGQIQREDSHKPDGEREAYYLYSYNSQGQIERQDAYKPNDEKTSYALYSYALSIEEKSRQTGEGCIESLGDGEIRNNCEISVIIQWFCSKSAHKDLAALASLQTQKTGCDSFGGILAACAVLPGYERAQIVNFKRGGSAYFCRL